MLKGILLTLGCVSKIMKKECACQDQEDEEEGMEEDEEAEQDEMLFEYAGEVLPNLGRAMSPESFAPYFAGLFQVGFGAQDQCCGPGRFLTGSDF
jgi:hypothetical protein